MEAITRLRKMGYGMMVILLMSCGSDGVEPQEPDSMPITVQVNPALSLHWQVGSRAGEVGSSIPAEMPDSIGVFGFNDIPDDDQVFVNQPMFYWPDHSLECPVNTNAIDWPEWNDWPYDPAKKWIRGHRYRFYAYAPYDEDQTYVISLFHPSYTNMATFRRNRIPPISNIDFVVADHAIEVDAGQVPTFEMVHLTSRLRFCFAVGKRYNELRDIYLRSISISDVAKGQCNYYECVVDLMDNVGVRDHALISISEGEESYEPSETGMIELIAENSTNDPERPGLKLPYVGDKGYEEFSSAYNTFSVLESPTLTVVYDVYDKAGQRVREAQTVTNTISLDGLPSFERGKCYDVRILITPKFLHVLSDNDQPSHAIIDIPFE